MDGETSHESAISVTCMEILQSEMDTPSGIATLVLFTLSFLEFLTTSAPSPMAGTK